MFFYNVFCCVSFLCRLYQSAESTTYIKYRKLFDHNLYLISIILLLLTNSISHLIRNIMGSF